MASALLLGLSLLTASLVSKGLSVFFGDINAGKLANCSAKITGPVIWDKDSNVELLSSWRKASEVMVWLLVAAWALGTGSLFVRCIMAADFPADEENQPLHDEGGSGATATTDVSTWNNCLSAQWLLFILQSSLGWTNRVALEPSWQTGLQWMRGLVAFNALTSCIARSWCSTSKVVPPFWCPVASRFVYNSQCALPFKGNESGPLWLDNKVLLLFSMTSKCSQNSPNLITARAVRGMLYPAPQTILPFKVFSIAFWMPWSFYNFLFLTSFLLLSPRSNSNSNKIWPRGLLNRHVRELVCTKFKLIPTHFEHFICPIFAGTSRRHAYSILS